MLKIKDNTDLKELEKFQKDNGVKTDENLVEKYATKTYIDKDYKDIVVSEKSFVNLVQENKKQKEILDKIKDYITNLQTIEKQYSAILSENAELENKITILQERIDKAYNYVLNCEDELIPANVGWVNDLKNILEGSDNNE